MPLDSLPEGAQPGRYDDDDETDSVRVQSPGEAQGEQRVVSLMGYRGECWCRWFGALRGIPLAAEFDIRDHVAEKHGGEQDD